MTPQRDLTPTWDPSPRPKSQGRFKCKTCRDRHLGCSFGTSYIPGKACVQCVDRKAKCSAPCLPEGRPKSDGQRASSATGKQRSTRPGTASNYNSSRNPDFTSRKLPPIKPSPPRVPSTGLNERTNGSHASHTNATSLSAPGQQLRTTTYIHPSSAYAQGCPTNFGDGFINQNLSATNYQGMPSQPAQHGTSDDLSSFQFPNDYASSSAYPGGAWTDTQSTRDYDPYAGVTSATSRSLLDQTPYMQMQTYSSPLGHHPRWPGQDNAHVESYSSNYPMNPQPFGHATAGVGALMHSASHTSSAPHDPWSFMDLPTNYLQPSIPPELPEMADQLQPHPARPLQAHNLVFWTRPVNMQPQYLAVGEGRLPPDQQNIHLRHTLNLAEEAFPDDMDQLQDPEYNPTSSYYDHDA